MPDLASPALDSHDPPAADTLRQHLARPLAFACLGLMVLFLPLLPLLASLAYGRRKYALDYWQTLKRMRIHVQALSEGPILHYFRDVAGRQPAVPASIQGACTQCGNCCLDRRCAFLEKTADDRYLCGIYEAPLRRYSNCGSFPLSAHDIERYACPGYTVAQEAPIHWVRTDTPSKNRQP